MNTLNNKWKEINLAMLILISASLILSTAVSVAPVFAAKQNSDKSKGDKDDKKDKDKDSNDSKSQQTESTISCNSNAETDDNSTENAGTPCDSQPESTETLNATSTTTAPVSIF